MTEYACTTAGGTWNGPQYECIEGSCQEVYICGDCNGDGGINSADVVYLINYLFIGGPPPVPLCIGDVNCDTAVNSADVVYLINYLFIGGPAPCPECCSLKAKMDEFPGQKIERDLPQKKIVPQKLPKDPEALKRME
ncbi:MAG: dockerin type I repeat-containing protein [Candidatus Zixiibacteriota bacterium]